MFDFDKVLDGDPEEFRKFFVYMCEGDHPNSIECETGNVTSAEFAYYFAVLDVPSYRELIPSGHKDRVLNYMPKHVSECPACWQRFARLEYGSMILKCGAGMIDPVQ